MEQQQFGEPKEGGLFEESVNLRHYWHIILERRWLVAATFAVVMVLCLFYLFTATSIFSATTRLQIDNETENSMRMESFVMEGNQGQDYLQTQQQSNMLEVGSQFSPMLRARGLRPLLNQDHR